jgi:hypothetical protein
MTEVVTMVALVAAGGCIAAAVGHGRLAIAGLAVPTALALLVVTGLVLLVLPTPAHPAVALVVVLGLGLAAMVVTVRRRGWTVVLTSVVVPALAAGAVVAASRLLDSWRVTFDSYQYLATAAVIADSGDLAALSGDGQRLLTRGLSLPYVHSTARLADLELLTSLGALLALSAVALLAHVVTEVVATTAHRDPWPWVVLGGTVLGLLTMHRFLHNVGFVHTHMLTAVAALASCVLTWQMVRGRGRVLADAALLAALLSLVALTRPEGTLFAALVLAPALAVPTIDPRAKAIALGGLGAAVTSWYLVVVWPTYAPAPVAADVVGFGALGLVMVALGATVRWWHPRLPATGATLVAGHALMWVALGLLASRDPATLRDSLSATARNLLGDGLWGYSLLVVAAMVLVVAWARPAHGFVAAFPLATFVPLALMLAHLRGEPYRVGPGDSLNRMWLHVLVLAAFLVVLAGSERPSRDSASSST